MPYEEAKWSKNEGDLCRYYEEALQESQQFRQDYRKRKGVIKASEMPVEKSRQGILKHVVNEKMNTRECCLDIYQQFLPPAGRSGKHRHMSEEVFFVLEGRGYDLHWDVSFDCQEEYIWDWEKEPKKFEWEEGDFVYVPPFSIHQHFNGDPQKPARIISATSRIVKAIGFDWLDQIEDAPQEEC
ncbi:MAG: cupin domain-containing protein [Candidatus Tectomicrobia bacterium]|uniref:Cupin domain-containing protein n=1 Tax=Tectimicrobiota bacterium TaxID=2528274 RepID=A0A932GQZ5_UNCTE|nr:cupin domain-containing protein [Candidatus Tectomicrobia bacterium]